MKRKLFAILICALVLGATSALADSKITGMWRLQGIMATGDFLNTGDGSYALPSESNTRSAIDQRFRVKWDNTINDAVSVTWYGEIDTVWGSASKGAIGGGGKVGADGVNVETKNVYATVKLASVTAKLGIQGIADKGLQSTFLNEDAAAAVFTTAFDKVSLGLILSKFDEGTDTKTDDVNLYGLQAGFAVSETMKFAAELYWNNVQKSGGVADDTTDLYTIGLSGDMKFGGVGVDAFVAYQTGTQAGDVDTAAIVASANAAFKAGPADLALRVIYYGNDDDNEDDLSFNTATFGAETTNVLQFPREGQEIMLTNLNKNNVQGLYQDRYAIKVAEAGYGLLAFVGKAGMNVDKFSFKGSVGYYMTLDDEANDDGNEAEGTDLGVEIDASVGYKLADNATLSVRGAYAMLGSFFDGTASDVAGEDPDDLYRAVCQLDVNF